MPSYTFVADSSTSSLTSTAGGLSTAAATTLARLFCDSNVGSDDLADTDMQNNFILELISAVGPVIAFDAVCRQLVKISNTVVEATSGTPYAALAENTYIEYLATYVLRDAQSNIEVSSTQSTDFLPQQFQTLAAFANARVPISQMLAVVDYHILMLYLTTITPTNVDTLNYTNQSNPYSASYSYSKYVADDNISTAKHTYSISTLAQYGGVVFSDAVSSDHIVAGVLADPVYLDNDDKIYGLIASLATVCSTSHPIRSTYNLLIKPAYYTLDLPNTKLSKNVRTARGNFTLVRLSTYSQLPTTDKKNMWFYNMVNKSSGAVIAAELVPGAEYDPTQKQLITVSALTSQSAQSIYNSLNLATENESNDASTAVSEIKTLKQYGKTIVEIRAITDKKSYAIPLYNTPKNFADAGFNNTELSNGFSSFTLGANYDFAVLIGLAKYDKNTTTDLRMSPVNITSGTYSFDYVDPNAIGSSTLVNKLKSIVTAPTTDTVLNLSGIGASKNLQTHILNCWKEYNDTAIGITVANGEPAILRFLHSSAALGATVADANVKGAFAASLDLPNMYKFSKLSYVLAASASTLTPKDFMKISEFATYKAATVITYAIFPNTSVKSTVADSSSLKSNTFYVTSGSSSVNQYYTLGSFKYTHYNTAVTDLASDPIKYFDNGATFTSVYPYMATSTTTKIDGIKSSAWPKEIVFSHYSLLLKDVVEDNALKMNPKFPQPLSDAALASSTTSLITTSALWCSFTDLLLGPNTAAANGATDKLAKFDNTSYKAILKTLPLQSAILPQYIKIDLAKNLSSTTSTEVFVGLGLPMDIALYVARNIATSSSINVNAITLNSEYSRHARRSIFANAQEAAQQLTADAFIGLVWPVASLSTIMNGSYPLNLNIVDLLTLTITTTEADAEGFISSTVSKRLAYNRTSDRQAIVSLFYPSIIDAKRDSLAALYNADDIYDFISTNNL
jgi:hypothetical protein